MTERNNSTDMKTRYEFLIAGIVVAVLCIIAFAVFKVTNYLNSVQGTDRSETTTEVGDGTVLIEVEIRETTAAATSAAEPNASDVGSDPSQIVNEHDDIHIFTVTTPGENYYQAKSERLKLYATPHETDEDRPSLMEDIVFEVVGFSKDGWAAIDFGGERYYVKSADIVPAEAPEDAVDKHKDPEDTQEIRFFKANSGDFEYVVTINTVAFSLPDVESSGNTVELKRGERVLVVGMDGNWYKITYMNAEYYALNYLQPRTDFIENNPDIEIVDNTGFGPVGSAEAAASAAAAGAIVTYPETSGDGNTEPSVSTGTVDPYDEANATAPEGYAREILTLTNAEREKEGLVPLVWDNTLAHCADIRAAELPLLTKEQNVNHLRPDGTKWYTVNEDIMYAENISYGQASAQEVFDAWVSSDSHYKNMMNPDYRTIGVSLYITEDGYVYYWIEEFGY